MRDAIVVGCGIVGATVSLALRKQGLDVLTIDDQRPMAGTVPSGGHLKPSWFSGMKKTEYEPAIELLDDVWGLIEEPFRMRPTGIETTVYRVDTEEVLATPRTVAKVSQIHHPANFPVVEFGGVSERARLLVVAAGVWCEELLGEEFGLPPIQRKRGVSFRFGGQLEHPFIKPWAPYKQVVAHQQGDDEIWVGDGSAILEQNWTDKRTRQCLGRCRSAISAGRAEPLRTLTGLRPYCKTGNDPCLLKRIGKRTWVVTGAGKSGTIGAGWAARRIVDAIV